MEPRSPHDESRLPDSPAARPPARRFRLLLVDDDPMITKVWSRVLTDAGHGVEVARSCAEARRTLAGLRRDLDLVILDLVLPDGWGATLIGDILRMRSKPRIAVVSGNLDNGTNLDLLPHCAVVLRKPLSHTDLLRLVEVAFEAAPSFGQDALLAEFCALYGLSDQQCVVLSCALRRLSQKETAAEMGRTPGTVAGYWHRILDKTGCHSKSDVVALFAQFVVERMTGSRPSPTSATGA